MTNNYPRITVVVPSFNQGNFLGLTLQSIISQQYPNLELIVIDGGSADDSVEVIKKYEKHIAYWVSEKDNGQVDAINKGLKMATGEWFAFQNSDDLYIGNTFSTFANALRENNSIDVFFGDLFIINEKDDFVKFQRVVPFAVSNQYIISHQIHNQSLFFKMNLLDRVGYFDEKYCFSFDAEYILRLANAGFTSCRVPGMYGAFRHHPMAKSSTIREVARKENKVIYKYYSKSLKLFRIKPLPTIIRYYLKKAAALTLQPGWLAYFWTLKKWYAKQLNHIKSFSA